VGVAGGGLDLVVPEQPAEGCLGAGHEAIVTRSHAQDLAAMDDSVDPLRDCDLCYWICLHFIAIAKSGISDVNYTHSARAGDPWHFAPAAGDGTGKTRMFGSGPVSGHRPDPLLSGRGFPVHVGTGRRFCKARRPASAMSDNGDPVRFSMRRRFALRFPPDGARSAGHPGLGPRGLDSGRGVAVPAARVSFSGCGARVRRWARAPVRGVQGCCGGGRYRLTASRNALPALNAGVREAAKADLRRRRAFSSRTRRKPRDEDGPVVDARSGATATLPGAIDDGRTLAVP